MKLVLRFRDNIVETVNWPTVPPIFKKPWRQPIGVRAIADLPTRPVMETVTYHLTKREGGLAFYDAGVNDISNF